MKVGIMYDGEVGACDLAISTSLRTKPPRPGRKEQKTRMEPMKTGGVSDYSANKEMIIDDKWQDVRRQSCVWCQQHEREVQQRQGTSRYISRYF